MSNADSSLHASFHIGLASEHINSIEARYKLDTSKKVLSVETSLFCENIDVEVACDKITQLKERFPQFNFGVVKSQQSPTYNESVAYIVCSADPCEIAGALTEAGLISEEDAQRIKKETTKAIANAKKAGDESLLPEAWTFAPPTPEDRDNVAPALPPNKVAIEHMRACTKLRERVFKVLASPNNSEGDKRTLIERLVADFIDQRTSSSSHECAGFDKRLNKLAKFKSQVKLGALPPEHLVKHFEANHRYNQDQERYEEPIIDAVWEKIKTVALNDNTDSAFDAHLITEMDKKYILADVIVKAMSNAKMLTSDINSISGSLKYLESVSFAEKVLDTAFESIRNPRERSP